MHSTTGGRPSWDASSVSPSGSNAAYPDAALLGNLHQRLRLGDGLREVGRRARDMDGVAAEIEGGDRPSHGGIPEPHQDHGYLRIPGSGLTGGEQSLRHAGYPRSGRGCQDQWRALLPLTRVRHLVRHAARHGYLVASFKVHGAEEVQAVVSAADAARAPAIVAGDVPDSNALLHHDIIIAVAESVTAAASAPIGIEVVSRRAQDDGVITTRADSSTFRRLSHAEYAPRTPVPEKADR